MIFIVALTPHKVKVREYPRRGWIGPYICFSGRPPQNA